MSLELANGDTSITSSLILEKFSILTINGKSSIKFKKDSS